MPVQIDHITVARSMPADAVRQTDLPIDTFFFEAEGVAYFADHYREPTKERPGLVVIKTLSADIGRLIRELVGLARRQHALSLFAEDDPRRLQMERALVVLAVLYAAIEYILDDDVHEPADDAFAQAKARDAEHSSLANTIQSLVDAATIADSIVDRITATLEDFDPSLIEEAMALSKALGHGAPVSPGRPASPDIDLRNRLMTLADDRVREVRKAAKWVFREHPEIVKQAMSAYGRRKSLEAYRRRVEEAAKNKALAEAEKKKALAEAEKNKAAANPVPAPPVENPPVPKAEQP